MSDHPMASWPDCDDYPRGVVALDEDGDWLCALGHSIHLDSFARKLVIGAWRNGLERLSVSEVSAELERAWVSEIPAPDTEYEGWIWLHVDEQPDAWPITAWNRDGHRVISTYSEQCDYVAEMIAEAS